MEIEEEVKVVVLIRVNKDDYVCWETSWDICPIWGHKRFARIFDKQLGEEKAQELSLQYPQHRFYVEYYKNVLTKEIMR